MNGGRGKSLRRSKSFRGTLGTQDQDSILRLGNLGWESPEIKKKNIEIIICFVSAIFFKAILNFHIVWSILATAIVLVPSLFRKERPEYNDALPKIVCDQKKREISGNRVSAKS